MDAGWERGAPRALGRYLVFDEIAAGGMASVYIGRHLGPLGFCRTVAIKRLHAQFAKDPDFVAMFVDEARLAARVQHPNVVPTVDVVTAPDELLLVMDYIHGETLSQLLEHTERMSPALAAAIMSDALYGLHAAHEAKDEHNHPLEMVHRDVSPQNMLVGVDGVTRMLDFGIAKATTRSYVTRDGRVKGKLAYMAPEQIRAQSVDRRADVFAAAVVLWELLTGERLFSFDDPGATVHHILNESRAAPSVSGASVSKALDEVVLRGLAHDPADRFASARDMAAALEAACTPASDGEVGAWVESLVGEALVERQKRIVAMEKLPARVVQREITRASSMKQAEIRSMIRVALERAERAEVPTEADALEVEVVGLDADTQTDELETLEADATETDALPLSTPIEEGVATQLAPRDERAPRWLIALVATLLGAGAAFAVLRAAPHEDTKSEPAAEPEPSSVQTAAPVVQTAEPAAPSETVAPKPPPYIRHTAKPSASTGDCNPPFYFEGGIKRFKRHCFAPR